MNKKTAQFVKKSIALSVACIHLLTSASFAQSFNYFFPKQYQEDRERSSYYAPDKVLQQIKRRKAIIRQKNDILEMAQSYNTRIRRKVDEQHQKNLIDLQNTVQMIEQEIAGKRQKRFKIAGEKEGFNYVKYDDGKQVWLKGGLVYQIEHEKIIDALGNVSYRNMYDMAYNEKQLMVSYEAEITDSQGITTNVFWSGAEYSEESVYYADDKTKAVKNLVSFTEVVVDAQGNITARTRSDCAYTGQNLLESYVEVSIDSFGNEQTKIWSGGQYDANKQIIGYNEKIIDSFGNETSRTWYGAQYSRNEAYDKDDPYQRQPEFLLTEYHMDTVDSHGNTTSLDWFGGVYDAHGQLVGYQENVIDELGMYSGKHWQRGSYDSLGRLIGYYEVQYDTFGNTAEVYWSNAGYDVYGNLLRFQEERVDSLGNKEVRERMKSVYNEKRQLIEYTDHTTDNLGNTQTRFWQAKEYDAHNRITAYFQEEIDALGVKKLTNWSGGTYDTLNRIVSYSEKTTDAFGNTTVVERSNTEYNDKGQLIYYQDKQIDAFGNISRETFKDAAYDVYGRLFSYRKELIDPYAKRTLIERTESFYDEYNRIILYKEERLDYTNILSKIYWYGAEYSLTGLLTRYQVDISKPGSTVSEIWSNIQYDSYGRMASYDLVRQINNVNVQRDYILPEWSIWSNYSQQEQTDLLSGKTINRYGMEVFLLYEETEVQTTQKSDIERRKIEYDVYGRAVNYTEKELIFKDGSSTPSEVNLRIRNNVYGENNELKSYTELTNVTYDDGTTKKLVSNWTAQKNDAQGRLTGYEEKETVIMYDALGNLNLHKETSHIREAMTYDINGLLESYTDITSDSSSPIVKKVQVSGITYNENFQMDSYSSKSIEESPGYKKVTITERTDMEYNPYGQLESYQETTTNPDNNITEYTFCFNLIYDALGAHISGQHQFMIREGYDEGISLYEVDLKKMSNMEYNHAGFLNAWDQEIMQQNSSDRVNTASIEIEFDQAGRQKKYTENGVNMSQDGTSYYDAYTLIKDNIQYNSNGLAYIWNQSNWSASEPDLITESFINAGYNESGQVTSYYENGTKIDQVNGALDESFYIKKDNITYNKLNQSTGWDQRNWSSAGEAVEEVSHIKVWYYRNGLQSRFEQNGTKVDTIGGGFSQDFSYAKYNITYNTRGQAVNWKQSSWNSTAPDLNNVSNIVVTYYANGLQKSYAEYGKKLGIEDTSYEESFTFIKQEIIYNSLGQATNWDQSAANINSDNLTVISTVEVDYDDQGRQLNYFEEIHQTSEDGETLDSESYVRKTNITYDEYGLSINYDNETWSSTRPDIVVNTTVTNEYDEHGMLQYYNEEGTETGINGYEYSVEIRTTKSDFTYNSFGKDATWKETNWNSAAPELYITTDYTIEYDSQGRQLTMDQTIHKYGSFEGEVIDSVSHVKKNGIEYNSLGQIVNYSQTSWDESSPDIQTISSVSIMYDSQGRQSLYKEIGKQVNANGLVIDRFDLTKDNFDYNGAGQALTWDEQSWSSQSPNQETSQHMTVEYDNLGRITSSNSETDILDLVNDLIINHTSQTKTGFTYNAFGQAAGWNQADSSTNMPNSETITYIEVTYDINGREESRLENGVETGAYTQTVIDEILLNAQTIINDPNASEAYKEAAQVLIDQINDGGINAGDSYSRTFDNSYTNKEYNSLGQLSAYNLTKVDSSLGTYINAESLEVPSMSITSQVEFTYDSRGRQYSKTETGTETSTDPELTYSASFSNTQFGMRYDSYGRLVNYYTNSTHESTGDMVIKSEVRLTYDVHGIQIGYEERRSQTGTYTAEHIQEMQDMFNAILADDAQSDLHAMAKAVLDRITSGEISAGFYFADYTVISRKSIILDVFGRALLTNEQVISDGSWFLIQNNVTVSLYDSSGRQSYNYQYQTTSERIDSLYIAHLENRIEELTRNVEDSEELARLQSILERITDGTLVDGMYVDTSRTVEKTNITHDSLNRVTGYSLNEVTIEDNAVTSGRTITMTYDELGRVITNTNITIVSFIMTADNLTRALESLNKALAEIQAIIDDPAATESEKQAAREEKEAADNYLALLSDIEVGDQVNITTTNTVEHTKYDGFGRSLMSTHTDTSSVTPDKIVNKIQVILYDSKNRNNYTFSNIHEYDGEIGNLDRTYTQEITIHRFDGAGRIARQTIRTIEGTLETTETDTRDRIYDYTGYGNLIYSNSVIEEKSNDGTLNRSYAKLFTAFDPDSYSQNGLCGEFTQIVYDDSANPHKVTVQHVVQAFNTNGQTILSNTTIDESERRINSGNMDLSGDGEIYSKHTSIAKYISGYNRLGQADQDSFTHDFHVIRDLYQAIAEVEQNKNEEIERVIGEIEDLDREWEEIKNTVIADKKQEIIDLINGFLLLGQLTSYPDDAYIASIYTMRDRFKDAPAVVSPWFNFKALADNLDTVIIAIEELTALENSDITDKIANLQNSLVEIESKAVSDKADLSTRISEIKSKGYTQLITGVTDDGITFNKQGKIDSYRVIDNRSQTDTTYTNQEYNSSNQLVSAHVETTTTMGSTEHITISDIRYSYNTQGQIAVERSKVVEQTVNVNNRAEVLEKKEYIKFTEYSKYDSLGFVESGIKCTYNKPEIKESRNAANGATYEFMDKYFGESFNLDEYSGVDSFEQSITDTSTKIGKFAQKGRMVSDEFTYKRDSQGRIKETLSNYTEVSNGLNHTYTVRTTVNSFGALGQSLQYTTEMFNDSHALGKHITTAVTADMYGRSLFESQTFTDGSGSVMSTSRKYTLSFDAAGRANKTLKISNDSTNPDKTITEYTSEIRYNNDGNVVYSKSDIIETGPSLIHYYTVESKDMVYNHLGQVTSQTTIVSNDNAAPKKKDTIKKSNMRYDLSGNLISFVEKGDGYTIGRIDTKYDSLGRVVETKENINWTKECRIPGFGDDLAKGEATITTIFTYDSMGRIKQKNVRGQGSGSKEDGTGFKHVSIDHTMRKFVYDLAGQVLEYEYIQHKNDNERAPPSIGSGEVSTGTNEAVYNAFGQTTDSLTKIWNGTKGTYAESNKTDIIYNDFGKEASAKITSYQTVNEDKVTGSISNSKTVTNEYDENGNLVRTRENTLWENKNIKLKDQPSGFAKFMSSDWGQFLQIAIQTAASVWG
ncbi:MAG: hypothetical protein ABII23_05870, partial [bacterium]